MGAGFTQAIVAALVFLVYLVDDIVTRHDIESILRFNIQLAPVMELCPTLASWCNVFVFPADFLQALSLNLSNAVTCFSMLTFLVYARILDQPLPRHYLVLFFE